MSSLREIKDRIGSVRSTLKITSAMKLVASAKLRKAQRAIESMRPYEQALNDILLSLSGGGTGRGLPSAPQVSPAAAVVVVSSNSSLCGGFNANIIRKAIETIREQEAAGNAVKVFAIGRRAADALKKAGYPSEADWSELVGRPSFDKSTALSGAIRERFEAGEFARVLLVYNHFVSAAAQSQRVEQYLPFVSSAQEPAETASEEEYIVEPSAAEVLETLIPQVMSLKFHAAVLDSCAAEHAARTVAMQTATDNAEDLLSELTLEYNKGRQQKITSEILDLLGGAAQ